MHHRDIHDQKLNHYIFPQKKGAAVCAFALGARLWQVMIPLVEVLGSIDADAFLKFCRPFFVRAIETEAKYEVNQVCNFTVVF